MSGPHADPPPYAELAPQWVRMSDGCHLAVRVRMPAHAATDPVPAIFEFLPYRAGDATAERDALNGRWLASHGYAHVRGDMRGNGDSEGIMSDEYLEREQLDGVEMVEWIARQPWCTGAVAMMGLSWGAFAGLQVAARRPAPLRTVISVAGTDDRFADDVHYKGGALLNDNLSWASVMLGYLARPPDPAVVGDRWRELWKERMAAAPLLAADWLAHPSRDGYWRQGSVRLARDPIRVPVLAVAGWADGYSNVVPRMVSEMAPRAIGLIGPWVHRYPHFALPEPSVGFLQLVRRWCDAHMRPGAEPAGLPPLTVFMQESADPSLQHEFTPRRGRWVAVDGWPSEAVAVHRWLLAADGLHGDGCGEDGEVHIHSPQTLGLEAGRFMPNGLWPDAPGDQRADDAMSVTFDGPVLDDRLEILGAPELELELASDVPQATICVRLCDVGPDGQSTRVSHAVLNLSHRRGSEAPRSMTPGRPERITIRLDDAAHAFLPGRHLRVALSTAYWPMVWPSPEPATLTVQLRGAELRLPVWEPDGGEAPPPDLGRPETGPPLAVDEIRPPRSHRHVRTDEEGRQVIERRDDFGLHRIREDGLEFGACCVETYVIHRDDPSSARVSIEWEHVRGRGGWQARVLSSCEMTADVRSFHLRAHLRGFEGRKRVHDRRWSHAVERRHL